MAELLTRSQVAELIGRDRRTVPRWTEARGITRVQDQSHPLRQWLYPAEPIRRVLAEERAERPMPAALRLHRFVRNPLNWPQGQPFTANAQATFRKRAS